VQDNQYTIGLVAEARWPFRNVQASTRIRCLDIIDFLKSKGIKAGLYRRSKKYDIIIFQKCFNEEHYDIARQHISNGTRIILDLNVNYFEKYGRTSQVTEDQISALYKFLELTDTIIVSSTYLKGVAEKYHPDVHYIPEQIDTVGYYTTPGLHEPAVLLYCGYAVKADSVLLIEDVIHRLAKERKLEFVFICDRDPGLKLPVKTSFIKYSQRNLANLLRRGDIKVAPRKLDNSYDMGHSFTKVGYPMSVGLPVVASPVPSYLETPALIADKDEEWFNHLSMLISDQHAYNELSQKGISFVRNNFSLDRIGEMFLNIFKKLCHA